MKRLLAIIGVAALLATANAQTNTVPSTNVITGPARDMLDLLSKSNLLVIPYGIYDTGSGHVGAGIAGIYNINEFFSAGLRLDFLNGSLWMPSVNAQAQLPFTLFGKVRVVPFSLAGVATPIAGKERDNGTVVGIFGAGLAVNITKKIYVLGDYEKWTSFEGNQLRAGVGFRF